MLHLGSTRSTSRREYLLHTPDSFVRTPLPGLVEGLGIVHVAPEVGAQFAMTTLELQPGGVLTEGTAQRMLYVLEGELLLELATERHTLQAGGFCFLPQATAHTLRAQGPARLILFEKPYQEQSGTTKPSFFTGNEAAVPAFPLNGDTDVQVRALLPSSMAFDFAVNTMTYAPGASLAQVEVHYMEHGLLMLEGGGIYRLGDDWHPMQAGDALWMAPFCPQWFAAVGKTAARYLIYKNFNRHVLG